MSPPALLSENSPGHQLGQELLAEAPWLTDRTLGVVCTPAWADSMAEDLVNTLEGAPRRSPVNVMCLWPTHFERCGVAGVTFHCQYREQTTPQDTWLVVAEGKGDHRETVAALARVEGDQPERLWVVAPSLDPAWVAQVRAEFPDTINDRLAFFSAHAWGGTTPVVPAKFMPGLVLRRRAIKPST